MLEVLIPLSSPLAYNTTRILDSIQPELGGPTFNVSWYLSRLGWKVLFVGPFGEYDNTQITRSFHEAGLEQEGLVSCTGRTDLLFSLIGPDGHRSLYLSGMEPQNVYSMIREKCEESKMLILNGSRHRAVREAYLGLLGEFEDTLVFNPSYSYDAYSRTEINEMLRGASTTIVNQHEARWIARILGLDNTDDIARMVSGTLIVTLGPGGARIHHAGQMLEVPSFSQHRHDQVGAGDAFLAGYLFEMDRTGSPKSAGHFAAALAAAVVDSKKVRAPVSDEAIRGKLT